MRSTYLRPRTSLIICFAISSLAPFLMFYFMDIQPETAQLGSAHLMPNRHVIGRNGELHKTDASDLVGDLRRLFERNRGSDSLGLNSSSWNDSENKHQRAWRFNESLCREQRNIYFAKTHKTGGTTVCNILCRFGISRNLRFALPEMVGFDKGAVKPNSINILTHHMAFDPEVQDCMMGKGTAYVTILREPLQQFISSTIYYGHITGLVNITGNSTEEKLVNFMRNDDRSHGRNYVRNQMSRDLGFVTIMGVSRFKEKLKRLQSRFRTVMLLEYFYESLILLRRDLCWNFKDIVFVPVQPSYNIFPKEQFPVNLAWFNESHRVLHREFSRQDHMLYDHFHQVFLERVHSAGPEFRAEVAYFKELNTIILKYCSSHYFPPLEIPETRWHKPFIFNRIGCLHMELNDAYMSEIIVRRQDGTF